MWSWLAKFLNVTSAEEREGASLLPGAFWEIAAPKDHAQFIRALPGILPEDSVLYLEGGSPDREIADFLRARAVEPRMKVALGTIWPRPLTCHLPASPENIDGLAALFERHATPEICIHFHAYHDGEIVLQWHDAFFSDPILLPGRIPEELVRSFCESCSCSYKLMADR